MQKLYNNANTRKDYDEIRNSITFIHEPDSDSESGWIYAFGQYYTLDSIEKKLSITDDLKYIKVTEKNKNDYIIQLNHDMILNIDDFLNNREINNDALMTAEVLERLLQFQRIG